MERYRLKVVDVRNSVAERDVLVDGGQGTGVGDVEGIKCELDLIPLTQLQRIVGMQIKLIVRWLSSYAATAADGNFTCIRIYRVRAKFADRLPGMPRRPMPPVNRFMNPFGIVYEP